MAYPALNLCRSTMRPYTSKRYAYNPLVVGLMLSCLAAMSSYSNARCQDGKTATSYYNLAVAMYKRRDLVSAIDAAGKAIRLAPGVAAYHHLKAAYLFEEQEDDATALLEISKACSIDPNVGEFWQLKARLLSRLNRFDQALECINKAIKIEPARYVLYTTKGHILECQGRLQEAEDNYTTAIKMSEGKDRVTNFNTRGGRKTVSAKLGHWSLVITDTTALISDPTPGKPIFVVRDAYLFQAQAFTALKKIEQARAVYSKALSQWPDDRQLRVQAKQFFESIGDKKNAQIQVDKLKQIDEDMQPLRG
jgi:tetratricopeptide (TPR) repeat protein